MDSDARRSVRDSVAGMMTQDNRAEQRLEWGAEAIRDAEAAGLEVLDGDVMEAIARDCAAPPGICARIFNLGGACLMAVVGSACTTSPGSCCCPPHSSAGAQVLAKPETWPCHASTLHCATTAMRSNCSQQGTCTGGCLLLSVPVRMDDKVAGAVCVTMAQEVVKPVSAGELDINDRVRSPESLLAMLESKVNTTGMLIAEMASRLRAERTLRSTQEHLTQALREQHALLTTIIEGTTDAVYVKDTRGCYVLFNSAAEKFTGRSAAEVLGHDDTFLFAPHEAKAVMEGDQRVMASGKPLTYEETVTSAEGVLSHFLSTKGPVLDQDKTVRGVFGIARNITARKQVELLLQRTEARFDALTRCGVLGVFVVDGSGHFTEMNETFQTMLGLPVVPSHDDRKWTLHAMVPQAWQGTLDQGFVSLQQDHRMGPVEMEFIRWDGSLQPTLLCGASLEGSSWIGLALDITRRKRLEAQLLIADRLASVGLLAAGVAHEINTPLTSLLGNVDLALTEVQESGAPAPFSDNLCTFLHDGLAAVHRIRNVVKDLRLFTGAGGERREPVHLQELLDSTLRMAQSQLTADTRVERQYAPVPVVYANGSRLGQVMLNLVVNAAQAVATCTHASRIIILRTRTDQRGWAVVEVTDTGVGMSPEVQRRLFTPFFTTKPPGTGTGLGLSISHGIITALGGELHVHSQPGVGSTFRVTLPQGEPQEEPGALMQAHIQAGTGGRVLVIDDDADVRAFVERVLRQDHQVYCVDSADAALRLLEQDPHFDVLVCDLMMPQMTGMELYQRLVVQQPEMVPRIIFMTGGACTPAAHAFLEQTPNLQIAKPFVPAELLAVVRNTVARFG